MIEGRGREGRRDRFPREESSRRCLSTCETARARATGHASYDARAINLGRPNDPPWRIQRLINLDVEIDYRKGILHGESTLACTPVFIRPGQFGRAVQLILTPPLSLSLCTFSLSLSLSLLLCPFPSPSFHTPLSLSPSLLRAFRLYTLRFPIEYVRMCAHTRYTHTYKLDSREYSRFPISRTL